jgi:tRNA A37 methylthiotransferase MiaB
VFGYSDEDGTEAASYDGKLDEDEILERTEHVTRLVEELVSQRAEDRIGERVQVLLETLDGGTGEGRAAHQGPEVDGCTTLVGLPGDARVGDLVAATVTGSDGADLLAEAVGA